MEKLVTFTNEYVQNEPELKHSENTKGALCCVTIDGYPEDETKSGRVVCEIFLTKSGEFIISWHENGYRENESVKKLIQASKQMMTETYQKSLSENKTDKTKALDTYIAYIITHLQHCPFSDKPDIHAENKCPGYLLYEHCRPCIEKYAEYL